MLGFKVVVLYLIDLDNSIRTDLLSITTVLHSEVHCANMPMTALILSFPLFLVEILAFLLDL